MINFLDNAHIKWSEYVIHASGVRQVTVHDPSNPWKDEEEKYFLIQSDINLSGWWIFEDNDVFTFRVVKPGVFISMFSDRKRILQAALLLPLFLLELFQGICGKLESCN